MANPLLQIDTLTKSFGDKLLFQEISFGIAQGDRIGLIARNGTGKTTLLNIIAGIEPYDSGRVVFRNNISFAYLPQLPEFNPEQTVLEACFSSQNEIVKLIARYEEIILSDNQDKLAEVLSQMDLMQAWDYEQRITQILNRLNITRLDQKIGELSGGQIKRIALANVLISDPDIILLDEPTNHLDLEMVEWLEDYLNRSNATILMVTHDRYFLDRVCSEIIEIDERQLYQYKGNYELEWMRKQPRARGTKAKSRIEGFYSLEEKTKQVRDDSNIQLAAKGSYIGNKIFEANNVSKRYDDIIITEDFNYIFTRYEKMGIVGKNGTGKSTFIKMLLGEVAPDSGHFDVGETVNFGYYSQDGLQFDDQMKVLDVVQNIAEVIDLGNGSRLTASQFLQHFLFAPEKQHDFVFKLSGGEKRRLYLCTVLIKNPNFLVLDEPTNDLDIVTLSILEEYLVNFKGCVIVISHDRYFMDKVVDHLMVFEGDGEIRNFPGNYSIYREWLIEEEKNKNEEAKVTKAEVQTQAPKPQVKTKLTYKEKQEFEGLEQKIADLEKEKAEITERLSSGKLSSDELVESSNRITALMELIDEKTMRWLELSEYAE